MCQSSLRGDSETRGNLFQLLDFHIALSANQNVDGLQNGDAFGVSLLSSHLVPT